MTRQIFISAFFLAAFLTSHQSVWGQIKQPDLVSFKSGDLELKGYLWKPSGDGPFPAVLWNHGSEKTVGAINGVAPYFVSKGFVFFVPHRRGQGHSPGPYIREETNKAESRVNAASS
jgi:carboxymethylenebutenolidase